MKKINFIMIMFLFIMSFILVSCIPQQPDDGLTDEERTALKNDKIKPEIIIEEGYEIIQFELGEDYDFLLGVKGIDNLQGDITKKISVDKADFISGKPGIYDIYYWLADYAGNNADVVIRPIKILDRANVKMLAHRGHSTKELENTLDAFLMAAQSDFGGIETDVRMTKDGKIFISHEDSIYNMSGLTGIISQMTKAELMALTFTSSRFNNKEYRFCEFREYLQICKQYDKMAVIDIKGTFTNSNLKLLVDTIIEEEMFDKTLFISFDMVHLNYIKQNYDKANLQFIIGLSNNVNEFNQLINLCLEKRYSLDCAFTNQYLTGEVIDKFLKVGLEVNVWTIDNPEVLKKFVNMGAAYITSNKIEKVIPLEELNLNE